MPDTIPRTIADRCVDGLEAAIAHWFAHAEWIRNDPDWETLHGNPRFETLLTSLTK